MTTETDKAKAAKAAGQSLAGTLAAFGITLGGTALLGWFGVLALGDLGVPVSFMGLWVGLTVALGVAKLLTAEVGQAWHGTRVKADINLIAASMAAQDAIAEQQAGGLKDLLSKLDKPADKDTGAYL